LHFRKQPARFSRKTEIPFSSDETFRVINGGCSSAFGDQNGILHDDLSSPNDESLKRAERFKFDALRE